MRGRTDECALLDAVTTRVRNAPVDGPSMKYLPFWLNSAVFPIYAAALAPYGARMQTADSTDSSRRPGGSERRWDW